jgi:Mce-associated membrane protein
VTGVPTATSKPAQASPKVVVPGTTPSGLVPLPTRQMLTRSAASLVLAAVAVLGIVGWRWLETADREQRTAAALDAARTHTVEVLSYDGAVLDADLGAARGLVTGELAARFDQLVTDLVLAPGAREQAVVSRAEVARAAVLSTDPDRVSVLLFVDRTDTSTDQPEPRRSTSRLVVTMTPVAGEWLIAELRAV